MKRFPELRPTRWDGLVVLLVLLLAAVSAGAVWSGPGEADGLTVVVSVDGEEVERCPLERFPTGDGVYSHNGYTLRAGLCGSADSDGLCVAVLESDCPTQDCVHTGEISRAGQSIVCLPARVIIQIEGGAASSGSPDIVIG